MVLSLEQLQQLFPKNSSPHRYWCWNYKPSPPFQLRQSPALVCCLEKKLVLKLYKVNVILFSDLATRGPVKNTVVPQIYNRAHHLKAFSGLKINCSAPQAGSGDGRMNRLNQKTRKEIEKKKRLCFLGEGWNSSLSLCSEWSGIKVYCTHISPFFVCLSLCSSILFFFFLSMCLLLFFPFFSPSLATHHLLHHTFSPFKEWGNEKGRE